MENVPNRYRGARGRGVRRGEDQRREVEDQWGGEGQRRDRGPRREGKPN